MILFLNMFNLFSTPHPYVKRLQKEKREMALAPPPGTTLLEGDSLIEWIVELQGAESTLYSGERFLVRFKFGNNYPLDSPEVVFLARDHVRIPIHPHIYSNGHICLSILYDTWSPVLTCSSICLSLISMLSSSEKKEAPVDDSSYLKRAPTNPKQSMWVFHDDRV